VLKNAKSINSLGSKEKKGGECQPITTPGESVRASPAEFRERGGEGGCEKFRANKTGFLARKEKGPSGRTKTQGKKCHSPIGRDEAEPTTGRNKKACAAPGAGDLFFKTGEKRRSMRALGFWEKNA